MMAFLRCNKHRIFIFDEAGERHFGLKQGAKIVHYIFFSKIQT